MLATVEIPGLAAAIRQESDVRRRAFLPLRTTIAGVSVRQITLGDALMLEEMQNGFFCPWRFDDKDELVAHCAQLVWWLSYCPKPALDSKRLWQWKVSKHHARLIVHLASRQAELIEGVTAYLRIALMDSPKGNGTNFGAPVANAVASICDLLAVAGYSYTPAQIMDMPLVQLWQLVRLADSRVNGKPLTNPSDKIACDYLASIASQKKESN